MVDRCLLTQNVAIYLNLLLTWICRLIFCHFYYVSMQQKSMLSHFILGERKYPAEPHCLYNYFWLISKIIMCKFPFLFCHFFFFLQVTKGDKQLSESPGRFQGSPHADKLIRVDVPDIVSVSACADLTLPPGAGLCIDTIHGPHFLVRLHSHWIQKFFDLNYRILMHLKSEKRLYITTYPSASDMFGSCIWQLEFIYFLFSEMTRWHL